MYQSQQVYHSGFIQQLMFPVVCVCGHYYEAQNLVPILGWAGDTKTNAAQIAGSSVLKVGVYLNSSKCF